MRTVENKEGMENRREQLAKAADREQRTWRTFELQVAPFLSNLATRNRELIEDIKNRTIKEKDCTYNSSLCQ